MSDAKRVEGDSIDVPVDNIPYIERTRTSPEEQQAKLDAALQIDPGLQAWTIRAVQFYLIVLCACCCSGDSGFDGTVMGGINAMKQYQEYFGMSEAGASTSIVFGIYTVAALPASYFPDKFGRRVAMCAGNCITIIGSAITATATTRSTFIGGRFLTGMGTAAANAGAKAFLAEITPPKSRGLFLGFLNSFFYVGQITATGMMVATGRWNDNLSWRLPLWIQLVPAVLNVTFVFLLPESPRWLYTVGKTGQARNVLAELHSSTADPHSPLVDLEMDEIEETIRAGGADKRWWDYRSLFHTAVDRRRTFTVMMMGAFGQLAGNNLITYFLPVLLGAAGITSQNRKLTLNFVNSITSYAGALTGCAIVDRVGRRRLLISCMCACVACLAIVTGLLSGGTDNTTRSNAGISFIYLFMVAYSFGWTPMQGIYATEILAYETRAKGLAFLNIVSQCASLINTFALPIALTRIKWKVYIIFLAWDMFEIIMLYLFLVETKGLTLEEIEEVFAQRDPRKYSIALRTQVKSSAPGRL
ncbi:general substrate transporter [Vararia minispora EC-137]|uniref:General substrate transporter n=1 Tax=Vararia minispora EC-137 TaxID=1314806 RepID=A0ACB8QI97_9AGAM|nr:general substrate transporter [Vararia minispora EC-137]